MGGRRRRVDYLTGHRGAAGAWLKVGAMSLTATASAPAPGRSFGEHLRDWRKRRRLSQMDMALEAEISTRHLSFLETGRAKPSREMVLKLAERLEAAGLCFSGTSPDGLLPETVEHVGHPWFIGVQFHPELKSRPFEPHPLFRSFVAAAIEQSRLV